MKKLLVFFYSILSFYNYSAQDLEWIGDPSDFFPPNITISYNDGCSGDFLDCMWYSNSSINNPNGTTSWIWEALENMHWQGGCDVSVVYSHLPCSDVIANVNQAIAPELVLASVDSEETTTVSIEVIDDCDPTNFLLYEFDVTVRCITCISDANYFCSTCDDAEDNCKLCDPFELAGGYTSCTPPCIDPSCEAISDGSQPISLCMATGIPNNMSWFAFVASSETLQIELDVGDCTLDQGIQAGIYDSCDWDNCIIFFSGGDSNCFSTSSSESSDSFIPGNTYYLWVDGCGGDQCEYTVTIVGLEFLGLPEMDAVTAYSIGRDEMLTDNINDPNNSGTQISPDGSTSMCEVNRTITVCSGELIQFGILHKGNPTHPLDKHQSACNEYSNAINYDFIWDVEWQGEIISNPALDGEFIPELKVPDEAGTYQICLNFIHFECDVKIGPSCLNIVVDESLLLDYYVDADGDGYGTGPAVQFGCNAPNGYTLRNGDCDDNAPFIYPGAEELCNQNDDNCDGQVDEGLTYTTYYQDSDMDGYGTEGSGFQDCIQPPDTSTEGGDCDDNNGAINPAAEEIPNNSIDENCDGETEIIDLDGDGWNSDLDCDDTNAAINPAAEEVPGNGIDEDCDGEDGPVSTLEINEVTIAIYPNPTSGLIYFDTELVGLHYQLTALDGRSLRAGIITDSTLDLKTLAAGVYVLELATQGLNEKVVQRIVKL